MFVAATSRCFQTESFDTAMQRLVDLEFSTVELMLHESDGHLKPSEVLTKPEESLQTCRQTHRLTPCALSLDSYASEPEYYKEFAACCRLAKSLKIVTLTVRSGELGTPFNAEVERLRELVAIGAKDGVRVGLLTENGHMTEDPNTAIVLCDNVKGLGISLDPSHFILGPHAGANIDPLMKYVYHVRLRDTSKEALQVQIGQGEIEYGRLIAQLSKVGYNRALAIDITPMIELDQLAELRKLRLLLESLL